MLHASKEQLTVMSMKLYVGNLSFQTSSEDLQQLFAQAGTVDVGHSCRRPRHWTFTRVRLRVWDNDAAAHLFAFVNALHYHAIMQWRDIRLHNLIIFRCSSSPYGLMFPQYPLQTGWGTYDALAFLVVELWVSGDLEDARGAESGVSWTRFEFTLR
jgi:RNA recognition motif-containing protein